MPASISAGDRVLCRHLYENLEDLGYGPSHRTITEIIGTVVEAGARRCRLVVESVGSNRLKHENGRWRPDSTMLRRPPVSEGDTYECFPREDIQQRSGSRIRQQVTVEKLSTPKRKE